MTKRDKRDTSVTQNLQPTRRDRFLPTELLAISAGLGVFVGLIVLVATREFILAGVALGITFIIALVLLALFALAFKPTAAEVDDLKEQDVTDEEKRRRADGGDAGESRPQGH